MWRRGADGQRAQERRSIVGTMPFSRRKGQELTRVSVTPLLSLVTLHVVSLSISLTGLCDVVSS